MEGNMRALGWSPGQYMYNKGHRICAAVMYSELRIDDWDDEANAEHTNSDSEEERIGNACAEVVRLLENYVVAIEESEETHLCCLVSEGDLEG